MHFVIIYFSRSHDSRETILSMFDEYEYTFDIRIYYIFLYKMLTHPNVLVSSTSPRFSRSFITNCFFAILSAVGKFLGGDRNV